HLAGLSWRIYAAIGNNLKFIYMKAKLISFSLLALLMLGTAALTSCSKDSEEAAEPTPADFGIADFMIVGETFWGMNQSGTPPYIMTFDVGGKTTIYTLSGQSETTYTVEGNRVTLARSEEHTSELQSRERLVCRLL